MTIEVYGKKRIGNYYVEDENPATWYENVKVEQITAKNIFCSNVSGNVFAIKCDHSNYNYYIK